MSADDSTPEQGQSADGGKEWEAVARRLLANQIDRSTGELRSAAGPISGKLRRGEEITRDDVDAMYAALVEARFAYEVANQLVRGGQDG